MVADLGRSPREGVDVRIGDDIRTWRGLAFDQVAERRGVVDAAYQANAFARGGPILLGGKEVEPDARWIARIRRTQPHLAAAFGIIQRRIPLQHVLLSWRDPGKPD